MAVAQAVPTGQSPEVAIAAFAARSGKFDDKTAIAKAQELGLIEGGAPSVALSTGIKKSLDETIAEYIANPNIEQIARALMIDYAIERLRRIKRALGAS
jgi:predicted NAD/FAD-dependent oxidoreductase